VCHVALGLPILGLVLFAVLPFPVAMPLYLVVVIVSALMYTAIWRALRLPPSTGLEAMIGGRAHVVESLHPVGVIRYCGELWRAVADEPVDPGTLVWIARVERHPEGLTALVHRTPPPGGQHGV
jgi:membrane protein implicated in regulation of membrane protease activity